MGLGAKPRIVVAAAVLGLCACGGGSAHTPATTRTQKTGPEGGPPAARTAAPVTAARCGKPVREHLITHPRWVRHVGITEYYSTPERLFKGRLVTTPGLSGKHRVDWLYSNRGVAMEGDGIGANGRHYHISNLGHSSWVNRKGHKTIPGRCPGHWSRGRPFWLNGGWRNRAGEPTFPLSAGGWSNGTGDHARSYGGVGFSPGSSLPLHFYRTLAVDPRLIPHGSRVYIPFYKKNGLGNGWFVAQDTGGAIIGRHVDVYRPPPQSLTDGGRYLKDERVYVVPPG